MIPISAKIAANAMLLRRHASGRKSRLEALRRSFFAMRRRSAAHANESVALQSDAREHSRSAASSSGAAGADPARSGATGREKM
jgi:hypothetical protein